LQLPVVNAPAIDATGAAEPLIVLVHTSPVILVGLPLLVKVLETTAYVLVVPRDGAVAANAGTQARRIAADPNIVCQRR
jgi:hypothetical protein